MVCMWVAFHENDGDQENNKSDEGQLRRLQLKELSAGLAEISEITEMTKTAGIQGAKKHGFPKQQVLN